MAPTRQIQIGSQYYVDRGDRPADVRAGIVAMREAGLRLVRVFLQWDQVEPRDGEWEWDAYDALFDEAASQGIGVVVTLMAVHPPGWMNITPGSQSVGPLESPAYWARAAAYVRRAAARYVEHPALHSWILWNEPSREVPRTAETLDRFRAFLLAWYGDVERYNTRHFRRIERFEEAPFPDDGAVFAAYGERLDWIRFSVWLLDSYLRELRDWVRAVDAQHPIHVNPHDLAADRSQVGQSPWAEGRLVDFIGCSAHPSWHSTRFAPERLPDSVAFFADLMRGATGAPDRYFWVTELQGGTNIYSGLTYLCPTAEEIALWVWECIGAGAAAVVFWCFNARPDGFEAGEWGMVDQQGRPSDRLDAVSAIAALLERHEALLAASGPPTPNVALLYSEASWRLGLIEGRGSDPRDPRNAEMGSDALVGAYLACRDLGVDVDIVDEQGVREGKLRRYKTLIVPGCTALEDHTVPALREWLEAGGTLIADGLCGYKDQDGARRDPRTSPVNALFDTAVRDIEAVPAWRTVLLEGSSLPVWYLAVTLAPGPDAAIHAIFEGEHPQPAITDAQRGRGRAVRIGTVAFQRYFQTPTASMREALRGWLPAPDERGPNLRNPSPQLHMRALPAPDGAILVLINTGSAVDAELSLPVHATLVRLTAGGSEDLPTQGGAVRRIAVPARSAAIYRAVYS